ncbi:hypothetical protein DUNSADRAFT_18694 [Dunaliella salina]|uniref:Major facilitator superfamily (MFS) profile domain-containing protein n=1 Tax=Dunaliella salina TaxID=3046 RepID=A0ABQ7FZM6_DUNSA|nr:hypothetical protein DUNSADRAFT_18694 [Dunaliella salina]|eukprot:KAF5827810.1 hypothetical protein DUNSADRAFT_18694 [Dunaliella salina]
MYMDSNNNQGPGIVNGVLPSKGDEENDTQALLSSAHSDKQQCAPSGQAVDDGRAHRETRAEQGDAQEPEETVDEVLERMGFTRTHWFLFLVTGLIWGADAMSVMLMSFLGPAARCEWELSPAAESFLSSAVFGGMLLGAGAWGAYADYAGRRVAVLVSCGLTAVCGVLSALSTDFVLLIIARTAVGFGLAAAPAAFILFKEWTPPRLRNPCMVVYNGWWTIGTMLEAFIAWALLDRYGWRVVLLVSSVPQAAVLAMFPFLPESPALLVAKEHHHRLATALPEPSPETFIESPTPLPTFATTVASWFAWVLWTGRKLGVLQSEPTLGGEARARVLLQRAGANSRRAHLRNAFSNPGHRGSSSSCRTPAGFQGCGSGEYPGGNAHEGEGGSASTPLTARPTPWWLWPLNALTMGMAERALENRRNGGAGIAERDVPPFMIGRLVVARQVQPTPPAITVASGGPKAMGGGPCQPGSPTSPALAHEAGYEAAHASQQDGVPGGQAALQEKTRSLSGTVEVDGQLVGLRREEKGGILDGASRGSKRTNLLRSQSAQHAQLAVDTQHNSGAYVQQQTCAPAPVHGLGSGAQGGDDEREGAYRVEEDSRPLLLASSRGLPSDCFSHEETSTMRGVDTSGENDGSRGKGASRYKQGEDGVWRPDSLLGKDGDMQDGFGGVRGSGGADDGGDGADSCNDGDSDGGKAARLARSHARTPLSRLFNKSTALVMTSMLFVWFTNACAYYGIAMLAAELNIPHDTDSPQSPPPAMMPPPAPTFAPSPSPSPTPLSGVHPSDFGAGSPNPQAVNSQGLHRRLRAVADALVAGRTLQHPGVWGEEQLQQQMLGLEDLEGSKGWGDFFMGAVGQGMGVAASVASEHTQEHGLRRPRLRLMAGMDAPPSGVCTGPGGALNLPASTYAEVVMAALMEVPSVLMCLLAVSVGSCGSYIHSLFLHHVRALSLNLSHLSMAPLFCTPG